MAENLSPTTAKGISKRALEYRCSITKIPEESRVNWENFYTLPCSNDFSLIGMYTEFFDIMGVLYDKENLRSDVLTHIKQEWRYYTRISRTYLAHKKLSFVNWFVGITTVSIPADELLVFACGVFLNIHITVDYTTGQWSTLDIPDITHNLAVALSDIHLAYRGNCKFSLLCKNSELHTKARKLFNRTKPKLKHIIIEKELHILIHRLDDKNTCPELAESTPNYPDSEDTEIYELEEKLIGTITFNNKMEETLPLNTTTTKNTKKPIKRRSTLVHHKRNKNLNFRCSAINCQTRTETRKEIDLHYKTIHVSKHYCKLCTKKYSTPYGLKQHLYMHRTSSRAIGHTCRRCKKIFPFLSQLKIHHLCHTKKQRYECEECFTIL